MNLKPFKGTRVRAAPLAGVLALSLFGVGVSQARANMLSVASANPDNWTQYNRTWNGWRYSPLGQINTSNVKHLHVAWIQQSGDVTNGLLSTPLVENGVMYYVAPDNNVYALNAVTGKVIWHYQPHLAPIHAASFYDHQSRNITLGHGFVYLGTLDGRVVAINQKTGKRVWSTQLTDLKKCYGCVFSSTPMLAGDVLIGGTTGGDQPTRGTIFGVNALTGKLMWKLFTTKADPASWPDNTWKVGGSQAWNVGEYDPKTNTAYIGVGNAAPDFYYNHRHGNNLYSSSVLALDPQTGHIKWYRQEVPHDHFDFDSVYDPLFINHDGRLEMVHENKNGFVWVMDAKNGKLRNVWSVLHDYTWVKSINPKTGRLIGEMGNLPPGKQTLICPYLIGASSWNPGAYNPQTGLWYLNTMDVCEDAVPAKQNPKSIGITGLYLGVSSLQAVHPPGRPARGWLEALNPFTGKVAWKIVYPIPGLGDVLTTAGGLVFNGDPEGIVHAYDARTGQQLWHFNVGSGVRGGIVSYSVNGKQYIAVTSGFGSLAPGFMASAFPSITKLQAGSAIVVFSLNR